MIGSDVWRQFKSATTVVIKSTINNLRQTFFNTGFYVCIVYSKNLSKTLFIRRVNSGVKGFVWNAVLEVNIRIIWFNIYLSGTLNDFTPPTADTSRFQNQFLSTASTSHDTVMASVTTDRDISTLWSPK